MPSAEQAFFVGHAPAARAARAAIIAGALLPILGALLAGAAALGRRDPGSARWDSATVTTFTGHLTLQPYATLHLTEPAGAWPAGTSLLVVDQGKVGGARAEAFAGQHVRVQGHALTRDAHAMIELAALDAPIAPHEQATPRTAPSPGEPAQPVELTGEIVDIKCYLGAMRPGDGLVHRACAILCAQGGIPPVLVHTAPDGRARAHVLLSAQGATPDPALHALIGLPVRVRGRPSAHGTQQQLRMEAIERLATLPRAQARAGELSFCAPTR